ncbi:MAG: hypothetical protein LBG71_07685 [Clostridiales Family XIII bacterium]|nr:hypothetical protein [Clostridiales Family XIII bacterium]
MAKFRKTFTMDGKRHDLTANSPEELAVKVAMRARDLEEGKRRVTRRMTVAARAREFMGTYISGSVSAGVEKDHERRLERFVLPVIGAMRLCDVKELHCQRVMNGMRGYSADRAKKTRNTLRQMFEAAMKNGLTTENPAAGASLPDVKQDGSRRPITPREREVTLTHPAGPS